jgi:hypothetical protein
VGHASPTDGRAAISGTTPEQRSEWSTLTDRLSADHEGHDVTIEIVDAEGGQALSGWRSRVFDDGSADPRLSKSRR